MKSHHHQHQLRHHLSNSQNIDTHTINTNTPRHGLTAEHFYRIQNIVFAIHALMVYTREEKIIIVVYKIIDGDFARCAQTDYVIQVQYTSF